MIHLLEWQSAHHAATACGQRPTSHDRPVLRRVKVNNRPSVLPLLLKRRRVTFDPTQATCKACLTGR